MKSLDLTLYSYKNGIVVRVNDEVSIKVGLRRGSASTYTAIQSKCCNKEMRSRNESVNHLCSSCFKDTGFSKKFELIFSPYQERERAVNVLSNWLEYVGYDVLEVQILVEEFYDFLVNVSCSSLDVALEYLPSWTE